MNEKACEWRRLGRRCTDAATVTYRSPSATREMALCDRHWDGVRKSLDDVFGSWERVAEVEYA